MRYVVTPLVGSVVSAIGITAFWLFQSMTGYRGKSEPWADPKPLAESWPDAAFVGLISALTVVVLVARAFIRRWRSTDNVGL